MSGLKNRFLGIFCFKFRGRIPSLTSSLFLFVIVFSSRFKTEMVAVRFLFVLFHESKTMKSIYKTISFKNKNKPFLFLLSTVILIMVLTGLKLSYNFNASVENYHDWSLSFRKVVIYRMDSIYYGFIADREFCKKKCQIFFLLGH